MNEIIPSDVVKETRELVKGMRGDLVRIMKNLHYLHERPDVWEGRHDSWGDFVESAIGLDQGFASRLRTIYTHYVIEGGLKEKSLEGVDHFKLHTARKLPGTPEDQLEAAKTLRRADLKQERALIKPHTPEWVTYCSVCGLSKDNHP